MAKKIMRIGSIKPEGNIFIKAEYTNGNFSMSGVVGPMTNGDCKGACGQINTGFEHRNKADNDERYGHLITADEIKFAPGWNKEKLYDLLDIWQEYHLNDLQAGCEHQRKNWNTKEKVELVSFIWSDKFHKMRNHATDGKLSAEEYEEFKEISAKVLQVTIQSRVKWLSPAATELLENGWIEEEKKETKAAGWVTEKEHPKGLLSKPCEVCGYKYGSSWLKKDVPEEIIEIVKSWPHTDIQPAWV